MKNLLTLCMALVFLAGATAQVLPCGMADHDMVIRAEMAAGCNGCAAPHAGYMPACIGDLGCVTLPVLATAPASSVAPFLWTSIAYDVATTPLLGHSIKPELSPPILAA